ncbi:Uncharacterised protein [Klebsiella pneumoniae]|nr:Uncharacterised protein [Klebsiella pneumoniae]
MAYSPCLSAFTRSPVPTPVVASSNLISVRAMSRPALSQTTRAVTPLRVLSASINGVIFATISAPLSLVAVR